jgi:phenylacetate-CoA ligase
VSDPLDPLETRSDADRRADDAARLAAALRHALQDGPFWQDRLAGVNPDAPDLAAIPVLRKADLPGLQAAHPPFGGLTARAPGSFGRLFLSPGPICEPGPGDGRGWGAARALRAAGLRAGDVVLNTFGYHLTPAGLMMDDAVRGLGCAVIPAGGGNTQQIVQAMAAYRPAHYIGTADYLNILLGAADAAGITVALRTAVVSGAAVPASLRAAFAARGIAVFELYGTAELGIIAYETPSHDGLVLNEGLIAEILDPVSGAPMPDGEVGELVVTPLRTDYPMFRLATGDLTAVLPGRSGCGRSNRRLRGWLGRADETIKVKGMFLRPGMLAEALARVTATPPRACLTVTRQDERDVLTLVVERAPGAPDPEALVAAVRAVTRLGCVVAFVDTLADGPPLRDQRPAG